MQSKPVVLLILDGWGHRDSTQGNAIKAARTPNWEHLLANSPHTLLCGSGEEVGLPIGQMGNSEVGHLTIGSGRVIYQDLSRITKAIENGEFFHNPTLKEAFKNAKQPERAVHLMSLLSPGGVHSHEDHLFAAVQMAHQAGCEAIYIHAFLDGRDTPPKSAHASVHKLTTLLKTFPNAHLASIQGRYYAMDRDQRWERVQLAYEAIVAAKAPFYATSGEEALQMAYARGETDEFVKPTCIRQSKEITIQPGDTVVFMNFRADRARQLTYALTQADFPYFKREKWPLNLNFVTLTEYDAKHPLPVVFSRQPPINVLGEVLAQHECKQLRLAETEKYAHVTFFFNGGKETPFKGEERILIPSPKIATYDLQPAMSAAPLTETLVQNILLKQYDFIVCNYANADMVGHTGDFSATIQAIEVLDSCLGEVMEAIQKVGGELLITADHGNAECMVDEKTHTPHTAHTTSLVPLVYFGSRHLHFKKMSGALADVAPTILTLMGIAVPPDMKGDSLITFS